MKKLLATILFALILVLNVYAFDKDKMSYNVYDETNTLSQETIDYLNKTTYDLKKENWWGDRSCHCKKFGRL